MRISYGHGELMYLQAGKNETILFYMSPIIQSGGIKILLHFQSVFGTSGSHRNPLTTISRAWLHKPITTSHKNIIFTLFIPFYIHPTNIHQSNHQNK